MGRILYPRPARQTKKKSRQWRVEYDLVYDYGSGMWVGYYHTEIMAQICAWYNVHVSSWGGRAVLINQWDRRL